MSTLTKRHDGLDRVLRGLGFIFSRLVSVLPASNRGLSGRTLRNLETAAAISPSATADTTAHRGGTAELSKFEGSRISRIRRSVERELEALMWFDPRMSSKRRATHFH